MVYHLFSWLAAGATAGMLSAAAVAVAAGWVSATASDVSAIPTIPTVMTDGLAARSPYRVHLRVCLGCMNALDFGKTPLLGAYPWRSSIWPLHVW